MEITIITLTVGLITYCFFRSIKAKSRVKKVELSDTDKEELNKLEPKEQVKKKIKTPANK